MIQRWATLNYAAFFLGLICVFYIQRSNAQTHLFNSAAALPATDALGRKLPTFEQTGSIRKNKFVGLFYWTWHKEQAPSDENPYNTTEILSNDPTAVADYGNKIWPLKPYPFFWGEPLFGYYIETDEWVLRKHAEMLADAGVDVIIFDCTNGANTWKESYRQLCNVFTQARRDGVKTPQIAFMLPFVNSEGASQIINELYAELYKPGLYKDLWFYWKGKPLILAYPELTATGSTDPKQAATNLEIRKFFTFRPVQPLYNSGPSRPDQWSWLEIYPQHGFVKTSENSYEEMSVGVAQNWSAERGLTAMNAPDVFGRSFTALSVFHKEKNAVDYGFNFQEQWNRALEIDPEFIFITGWNEWIAGRYALWNKQTNAFPDEFNQEGSRDIEPMRGGHGDNYYYQMVSNIRYFKGMPYPDTVFERHPINIDGRFRDWDAVRPYLAYRGNTIHRNSKGWGKLQYVNNTGRNDITTVKITSDRSNIYFYVETASELSKKTDEAWMRLFIDADRSKVTGWEGYDFVVNHVNPKATAIMEKNLKGWTWTKTGDIIFKTKGNKMELKIPKSMIKVKDGDTIEFKWSDNMQKEGDIHDFLINGDTAPAGRFNYFFKVP